MSNEKFCTAHNTPFFKKGNMRGFAHPIEGTNQWCNMSKEQEAMVEQAPPVQQTATKTEAPKTTDQRIAEQVAIKEIGLCWRSGRMTEAEKDEMSLIERYKQWLLQNTGIWVVEKDK